MHFIISVRRLRKLLSSAIVVVPETDIQNYKMQRPSHATYFIRKTCVWWQLHVAIRNYEDAAVTAVNLD